MQRLFRTVAAVTIAVWLLGASNCSKTSNSDAPQFVITLQVENSGVPSSSFTKGDSISLVLTIRNRTDAQQSLFFNSSEFANFAALNAGTATVVWTCDGDSSSIAATCTSTDNPTTASTGTNSGGNFVQINLTAFQTQTITFTWTGLDNNGDKLAVGNYEVFGGFTVYNTTGPGSAAANGSSMAQGSPTAKQMFPSVYISTLVPFTITQ